MLDPIHVFNEIHDAGYDTGAISVFIGRVRRDDDVVALTLEYYPRLGGPVLNTMAASAIQRWSLDVCIIHHRIGRLKPGDDIVLVASAARQRKSAIAATSFLIDQLKTEAPFWKKEELTNNAVRWVTPDAKICRGQAATR